MTRRAGERSMWTKVLLVVYSALLSCNFLYVPWCPSNQWKPDPQYLRRERPPVYDDGWLFRGPGKPDPMAPDAYNTFSAYRYKLPYARPDALRILLRTLAILAFAPLVVGPSQARAIVAKLLRRIAHRIGPGNGEGTTTE